MAIGLQMRAIYYFTFVASTIGAYAIMLVDNQTAPAAIIQHSVQRRPVANPIERDRSRFLKRQSGTARESLDNEKSLYYMNITMGTPAQHLSLDIDTGSSDLWVNVESSQLCKSHVDLCAESGMYSANRSSTYQYLNSQFSISYIDGSGAAGDYATDVVRFGGVSLTEQQLGIGYSSSSQHGILGIGYPANEAAVARNGGHSYPNVPVRLMLDGHIRSNAYSLWLNDLNSSAGSILFGGVDTNKYAGQLETLPILKAREVYTEFSIALTAVGANGNPGSIMNNIAVAVVLDSGTSLTYLPNDVTHAIYSSVNAQYDSAKGAAFVDCGLSNHYNTIDFTFSSPTIKVPLSELVIVAGSDRGQPFCIFGIAPAAGGMPVLGDTFIRSAYVVYDMTNNEISLAQTRFHSTSENILEITNSSGVPGATKVPSPIISVAMGTGDARDADRPRVSSNALAAPTAPIWNLVALFAAAVFSLTFTL